MLGMKLFGIIGKPLGHSLSPKLHNWAFAELRQHAFFEAWPIDSAHLEDFITAMHTLRIRGLCVTIPHKQAIIPFLDEVSPRAKSIGAVNTLYWQGDKLCGENTDVDGFKLPLMGRKKAKKALVFGAGGAARAVIVGLQELGVDEIYISNRDNEKATKLAHEFAVQNLEWEAWDGLEAEWLINTTPLGMKGAYEGQSPYVFKEGHKDILAYDIVYNPLKTKFLHDAEIAGCSIQDGLDMFVGQALSQMQLWMGKAVEPDSAREFLLKTLKFK